MVTTFVGNNRPYKTRLTDQLTLFIIFRVVGLNMGNSYAESVMDVLGGLEADQ